MKPGKERDLIRASVAVVVTVMECFVGSPEFCDLLAIRWGLVTISGQ